MLASLKLPEGMEQGNEREAAGKEARWHYRPVDLGGRHLEYVPGRDELISPETLAQGKCRAWRCEPS